MERQVYEAMGHFSKGFQVLTDAFIKAGASASQTPSVSTQDAVSTAQGTTERAKKAADKKAPAKGPKTAETESPITTEEPVNDEPVEQPAPTPKQQDPAPAPAKGKSAKKEAPDFETLDRDGKIQDLRSRMVMVAQKCGGDSVKTYSFLKKYKAMKVHELTDENLGNLKNDIEVFLAGPDAGDF